MEGEHVQEINSINAQINQMKADHELFIEKQEANYNEKLIMEYNKYLSFEAKMEQMIKEQDDRYYELKKTDEKALESVKKEHENQLQVKEEQYEEVRIKSVYNTTELLINIFENSVGETIQTKYQRP